MADRQTEQWKGFLPENSIVMRRKGGAQAPKSTKVPATPVSPVSGDSLEKIKNDLGNCQRCKLGKTRTNIVFGEGNPKARLVFVGEAPGEQEDLSGRPFVGRAGQLLEKMIQAIGLKREDVYICNVVKSRPPENRNPEPDEIEACKPFLHRQLDAIKPEVIVPLGKFAAQTLLQTETRISELRGKYFDYRGTPLIPTFHPSYLLRNPSAKKEAWEDFQKIANKLGLKIPASQKAKP